MRKIIPLFFAVIMLSACSAGENEHISLSSPDENSSVTVSRIEEQDSDETVQTEISSDYASENNESAMEEHVQKKYAMHIMETPIIIGHTGNSCFVEDFLYFSAQVFSKEADNFTYDGESCIYKVDLSNESIEIIRKTESTPDSETSIRFFVGDKDGNFYYVTSECIEPEEKYSYTINQINESGNTVWTKDIFENTENAPPMINSIISDNSGNWYVSAVESIFVFDSDFSCIREVKVPNGERVIDLIRLDDNVAVVLSNDIYEIYVFNSEKTEITFSTALPENTSQVFKGSAGYDFFYLTYDENYSGTLYGGNISGDSKPLFDYNDYFSEDIGTLNIYVDDKDNIFLLVNGDFYLKSPISKIIVFSRN